MIDAIEALYPGVKEARVTISATQASEQWEPFNQGNPHHLRLAFFEGFRQSRMYDGVPELPAIGTNGPEKRRPGRPPKKQQPEPPAVTKINQPELTGVIVVCPATGDAIDTAFCDFKYGCPSDPDTCMAHSNKTDEGDQI